MSASINLEITAGTAIETASADAQRVADMLGINCEFKFNDVKCLALPGGSASQLAERQQAEQGRKSKHPHDYKFCTSRREITA